VHSGGLAAQAQAAAGAVLAGRSSEVVEEVEEEMRERGWLEEEHR